jgi:two-component system, cell cycle sensor histidine kinase and response regulator CckA
MWELDIRTGSEFAAMLGYNKGEFKMLATEWIPPLNLEDKDLTVETLGSCLQEDLSKYCIELRMRSKSGGWKWYRLQGKVVERDTEGKPVRMIGMHKDITKKKRTEENIRLWRNALELSPDAIALTDLDGTIRYANPAWITLHGYISDELKGKNLSIFHTVEQMEKEVNPLMSRLLKNKPVTREQVGHKRKDGSVFPTRMTAFIVKDDNKHANIITFAHDITDDLKKESLFRQTQKMEAIGQLSGGIAHDLNNLLAPILGYADMILHDLKPDDRYYKELSLIKRSSERAKDLTWQLLAFSRKQILEMKKVDLIDVIAEFQKILRRTLHEDIVIKVVHSSSHIFINADMDKIRQVLINLTVNAQNAMPDGGTITIEAIDAVLDESYTDIHPDIRPGSYALLSFSDTGCGMDRKTMEHVFEPFFTTKDPGKGPGLGLAMVYGIVKQHGGHVMVYSGLGLGTTFKIYLPIVEQGFVRAQGDESVKNEMIAQGTETVLVVEDEDAVRELLCTILQKQGYTVISTDGAQGCFKAIEKHKGPIHLLLTDVVMPGINGRQIYEHLSLILPDLKVIFISGHAREVFAEHGILMQGIHFIPKPFTVKSLSEKVRAVLDT